MNKLILTSLNAGIDGQDGMKLISGITVVEGKANRGKVVKVGARVLCKQTYTVTDMLNSIYFLHIDESLTIFLLIVFASTILSKSIWVSALASSSKYLQQNLILFCFILFNGCHICLFVLVCVCVCYFNLSRWV